MPRTTCLTILSIIFATCAFGQIDVKIDPLSLALSKNFKGGLEIGIEDQISIDADGLYSATINLPIIGITIPGESWGTRIIGKYYFKPKYALDQFYVGPYLKYRRNFGSGFVHQRAAIGIISGYKFFMFENSYMELGFGFGARVFSSLKNPIGDFIDDQLGTNTIEDFWNTLTTRVGRADFTSRLLIGYRIDGFGPRTIKQQEKEITP